GRLVRPRGVRSRPHPAVRRGLIARLAWPRGGVILRCWHCFLAEVHAAAPFLADLGRLRTPQWLVGHGPAPQRPAESRLRCAQSLARGLDWGAVRLLSSVGQSICLVNRGSPVRIRQGAPLEEGPSSAGLLARGPLLSRTIAAPAVR